MPQINPVILYDTLNRLQMRLYDIYVACTNIEIADAILSEREFVISMMKQIEVLLSD
jgi:hypothetical protein